MSPESHGADASEIFVLGAGFSRAVACELPLTDELGELVLARDQDRLGQLPQENPFGGVGFEAWLSRRAEAQPYLNVSENLRRQAIFTKAVSLVAEILDERVDTALSRRLPVWLGELISLWHLNQSPVITFNYDPLVECAFQTLSFWDWRQEVHFQWGSLINYTPTGTGGVSYAEQGGSAAPHPSFRLYKMHGSHNWYWVPGDESGATVQRVRLPGTFGSPEKVGEADRRWLAPGRERFIVPPAAAKTSYYANPISREIWRGAFDALSSAGTVTLMGYSLPATDLSTSGMFAEANHASKSVIRVVDRNPGAISDATSLVSRLSSLATPGRVETLGCGDPAIEDYVATMLSRAAEQAVKSIQDLVTAHKAPVFIDWGSEDMAAAVIAIAPQDSSGTVVFEAESLSARGHAQRSRQDAAGPRGPYPVDSEQIVQSLASAKRVVVRMPGGSRDVTVIDAILRHAQVGHSNVWVQLVPAGAPPEPRT